jgi:hypothetical protein
MLELFSLIFAILLKREIYMEKVWHHTQNQYKKEQNQINGLKDNVMTFNS